MSRALLSALLLAACSREPQAAPGSSLTLDYELSSDGAVVDTSAGREPMTVVLGRGDLPAAVEAALAGAKMGETKIVEVAASAADPAMIRAVPLAKFGAMAGDLKPGAVVAGAFGGAAARGRVLKIESGSVTLDFNDPLAGKRLTYKVKVLAIRAAG